LSSFLSPEFDQQDLQAVDAQPFPDNKHTVYCLDNVYCFSTQRAVMVGIDVLNWIHLFSL